MTDMELHFFDSKALPLQAMDRDERARRRKDPTFRRRTEIVPLTVLTRDVIFGRFGPRHMKISPLLFHENTSAESLGLACIPLIPSRQLKRRRFQFRRGKVRKLVRRQERYDCPSHDFP